MPLNYPRFPYTAPTYGSTLPPLPGALAMPGLQPPPLVPADTERPSWFQQLFGGDTGMALGQLAPSIAGAPNLHSALAQLGQIPAIRQAIQFERADREREGRDYELRAELDRNEEARRQEQARQSEKIHRLNMELGGQKKAAFADEAKIRQAEEALRGADPGRMTPLERLEADRLAAQIKETKARQEAIQAETGFTRKRTEVLGEERDEIDKVAVRQQAADARRAVEHWQTEEIQTEREIMKLYGADREDWPADAMAQLDKIRGLRKLAEAAASAQPGNAPTGGGLSREPGTRPGLAGAVDIRSAAVETLRAKAKETVGRDLTDEQLVRIMGKFESLSPERQQEFLERLQITRNLAPLLTEFGF